MNIEKNKKCVLILPYFGKFKLQLSFECARDLYDSAAYQSIG